MDQSLIYLDNGPVHILRKCPHNYKIFFWLRMSKTYLYCEYLTLLALFRVCPHFCPHVKNISKIKNLKFYFQKSKNYVDIYTECGHKKKTLLKNRIFDKKKGL